MLSYAQKLLRELAPDPDCQSNPRLASTVIKLRAILQQREYRPETVELAAGFWGMFGEATGHVWQFVLLRRHRKGTREHALEDIVRDIANEASVALGSSAGLQYVASAEPLFRRAIRTIADEPLEQILVEKLHQAREKKLLPMIEKPVANRFVKAARGATTALVASFREIENADESKGEWRDCAEEIILSRLARCYVACAQLLASSIEVGVVLMERFGDQLPPRDTEDDSIR
jgi:hypothetical protein